MECCLKWVHMARYELILRLDGALWLPIISKTPLVSRKAMEGQKNPKESRKALLRAGLTRLVIVPVNHPPCSSAKDPLLCPWSRCFPYPCSWSCGMLQRDTLYYCCDQTAVALEKMSLALEKANQKQAQKGSGGVFPLRIRTLPTSWAARIYRESIVNLW